MREQQQFLSVLIYDGCGEGIETMEDWAYVETKNSESKMFDERCISLLY